MTALKWCKLSCYNICVLVFQVSWHLYLTGNGNIAKKIAHFYFYRDTASGKGASGWLDVLLPSILCGWIVGWVTWEACNKKMGLCVLVVSAAICFLQPLYSVLIDKSMMWWWPRTSLVVQLVKIIFATGFFALLGREFAFHSKIGSRSQSD